MRIHFIVHESFEAPGAYTSWAHSQGHAVSHSKVYQGEALPESADRIDFLIIMGGPQSPATTKAECPHFDAAAETSLISKCVAANRAVIGVCLGSQLIGEALGARFDHSPEKEIGKFPILLTRDGLTNEKFAHFGDRLDVGHWHNDMPGLTPDAKIIAYSEGCPRQIVEYSKRVYGFQCHMEFNPEVIELLIAHADPALETLAHHRFVQQAEALRQNDYSDMNAKLFMFLDKLSEEYRAAHP
jgi:GMP synthase (glutamine-hydrolysing)